MIRIGNQTALSASSIMQPFEYAVVNGFDAFEFFPDKKESGAGWEERDVSGEERKFIRDHAFTSDIRLSVHTPPQSNPLAVSANGGFSRTVEFARDIGASLINIHFDPSGGIAAFADNIVPLAKRLTDIGIRLSIENTIDNVPADLNELFRRLRGYMANVGMCLDIGHANLCSATRNDYLKFIDLLDPAVPIIHIHMHENYGDYDSHLPIFTGPAGRDSTGITGFIHRMKKRNFSGSIILEQWPHPATLLNEARKRLLEIIEMNSKF